MHDELKCTYCHTQHFRLVVMAVFRGERMEWMKALGSLISERGTCRSGQNTSIPLDEHCRTFSAALAAVSSTLTTSVAVSSPLMLSQILMMDPSTPSMLDAPSSDCSVWMAPCLQQKHTHGVRMHLCPPAQTWLRRCTEHACRRILSGNRLRLGIREWCDPCAFMT